MFRKVSNSFGTSNKKTCMVTQQADKVYKVTNSLSSFLKSNTGECDLQKVFLKKKKKSTSSSTQKIVHHNMM